MLTASPVLLSRPCSQDKDKGGLIELNFGSCTPSHIRLQHRLLTHAPDYRSKDITVVKISARGS